MDSGITATLIGLAGGAALTACGSSFHLYGKFIALQTEFTATQRMVEQNNARIVDHNAQLAELHVMYSQGLKAQTLSDERLKEITSKLDVLPRLQITLENLDKVCATIVPRQEIDMRFNAVSQVTTQTAQNVAYIKSNITSPDWSSRG